MSAQFILSIALIIVACVFSALLTFAIFYMRELKSSFDRSQSGQDEKIEKLEEKQDKKIEKIDEKLEKLPEKYVFRDDFIRWTIGVDKRIDDVAKDVKALLKQEGKSDNS